MSIPGIGGRRSWKKEKQAFGKVIEVMQGKYIIKPKSKKRAVETSPRNMSEKQLERDIIFTLKCMDCVVTKSGEQSTYNSHLVLNGISDLIVFCHAYKIIFMECKLEKYRNTKNGGLRPSQVEFKAVCEKFGLKYVVVYNVGEARSYVE